MQTGHESRVYGPEITWKDGNGSVFLIPNEKPRIPDPYVEPGNPCPRCQRTDRITWTFNTTTRCMEAHCGCGYIKEQYTSDAMPMTDDLRAREVRGGHALIKLICAACGASYRTQRANPKQLCQKCRDTIQGRKWREENQPAVKAFRKKYKERRLKLGLSSGGAGGDVENIAQERRATGN